MVRSQSIKNIQILFLVFMILNILFMMGNMSIIYILVLSIAGLFITFFMWMEDQYDFAIFDFLMSMMYILLFLLLIL